MKHPKTFVAVILAVALLAAYMPASLPLTSASAAVAENDNGYYYAQLDKASQKFYNAIAALDLTSGTDEYDLMTNGVVTDVEVSAYIDGTSNDMLLAFGRARDAFVLDHPEVFYVDFSYLSINVGTKNGNSVASLGSGRSDNYFLRNDSGVEQFTSQSQVQKAVSDFNAAVTAIVDNINSTATSSYDKIVAANQAIVDKAEYAYDEAGTADESPLIHTAYGALVNGSAVCEGYAKALKVVLNKLGIDCELVQGLADVSTETETLWQAHMWNYVKLENRWYGIDSTWNDTTKQTDRYLLLGATEMNEEHQSDGVVSSVGFEFSYPVLDAYNYMGDRDGFTYAMEQYGDNNFKVSVGYEEKSDLALAEEGKYIAFRTTYTEEALNNSTWTALRDYPLAFEDEDTGKLSFFVTTSTYKYIQFAVFNVEPNYDDGLYLGFVDGTEPLAQTRQIENGYQSTYAAAPFVSSLTPATGGYVDPTQTYEAKIVYDEALKLVDGASITLTVYNSRGGELTGAKITDIEWDGNTTITFTFKPDETYGESTQIVKVGGLVSASSGLAPNDASFRFLRRSVVCSKVFNDGRLWMDVYGNPTPISNNDLSDENYINQIPTGQRSQLILVASKPDEEKQAAMDEKLAGEIDSSAVMNTTSYEIDIQLCGCVKKVPEGSYMQIGFGFPDGYGPEDAGVTFKVYHYKTDADGNITGIEEVPCVITEYGLVATVTSFSPFTIVVADSSKVENTAKYVYAEAIGEGTVSSSAKGIATVNEGESVTYTFTPKTGYSVETVLVNGVAQTVSDNQLTLSYDQLVSSNTVEVYYVADSVVAKEAANGITNTFVARRTVSTSTSTTPTNPSSPVDPSEPSEPSTEPTEPTEPSQPTETTGNNTVKVVIAVVAVVIVLVAVAALVFVFKNKKKSK